MKEHLARCSNVVLRDPLFVLCPPRSYSTVTMALLSGHPEVFAFPEMSVFHKGTLGRVMYEEPSDAKHEISVTVRRRTIVRGVSEALFGGQAHESLAAAREWLGHRAARSPETVFAEVVALLAPRLAIEKTPSMFTDPGAFERCQATFPKAKFLHLTRHPTLAIPSLARHIEFTRSLEHLGADPLQTAAGIWCRVHTTNALVASKVEPDRYLRVKGEHIVNRATETLPSILDWLGLDAGPGVIEGMLETERWRFVEADACGNRLGGDYKFFQDPKLHTVPEPAGLTSEDLGLSAEQRAVVHKISEALGY